MPDVGEARLDAEREVVADDLDAPARVGSVGWVVGGFQGAF